MRSELVDRIVNALLYEGYILYPYRPALKNRQRWTFGGLVPRAYSEAHSGSDAWTVQTQCLAVANPRTTLEVRVRFLHLMGRTVGKLAVPLVEWPAAGEPEFHPVDVLHVGDQQFQPWQEAVEREVPLDPLPLTEVIGRRQPEVGWDKLSQRAPAHREENGGPALRLSHPTSGVRREFAFPGCRKLEPLRSPAGELVGVLVREQQPLEGAVELSAERFDDDLLKVTVTVLNRSQFEEAGRKRRDEALMRSLVSTHTLLGVQDGEFVSLLDPPERWREIAAGCRNIGTWPVLVGEVGQTDTLLSAPIILYDYPQVAAESPGDLFDGTEIDEILTLRILTLTDDERQQAGSLDEHSRRLLERTEALTRAHLAGLHGKFGRVVRDALGQPE